MIWLGGNDILAGRDDARRLRDVHLLHRPAWRRRWSRSPRSARRSPRRSPASIASARSSNMQTEDEADAGKPSLGRHPRRRRVRGRVVRVQPGQPGAEGRVVHGARRARRRRWSGSSGSGKSTLISLVMAFNRPTQGPRARRRHATSTDVPLRDYREQLASVLQENFLFDGTIAENIGYAKPGATRDEIKRRRAASRTATSSSCSSPRATTRSSASAASSCRGGQRQRVSIARAILAQPAHPDPRRGDLEPRQRERSR